MANAVGVKIGDRETRDIVDIWSLMPDEFNALAYFDPKAGERDYKNLPEAESLAAARNREAYARLAWSPYMHNPKLKNRLHRIKLPTLFLWGMADRILSEKYGRGYCALIAGAKFETDREGRPLPASRAAGGIRPPRARVRRRGRAGHAPVAPNAPEETCTMQVYYFTEQPYYPAWNNHSGLAAREPAEQGGRSEDRRRSVPPLLRRVEAAPTSSATTSWSTSTTRPRPACRRR